MHVVKKSFQNNPNVGLYGFCYQDTCLLGPGIGDAETAEALGLKIEHVTIAGTEMPGIFLAGNKNALLVPGIAFEHEVAVLEKLGLPVKVFDTKLTCLGNNVIANEQGCLVNPGYSDEEISFLADALQVPVKRMEIAGLETPGACLVVNGTRAVIHREAEDFEIDMVKSTLHLEEVVPASVNLGSPYLRAGVLASTHGFVVGNQSGGPEIVHLDESLGYEGE